MTPTTKVSEITLQELEEFFTRILRKQFPLLLDDAMKQHYLPAIEDMIDNKLNHHLNPIKTTLTVVKLRLGGIEDRLENVSDRLDLYTKKVDRHLLHHEILETQTRIYEKKRQSLGAVVSDKPKKTYG